MGSYKPLVLAFLATMTGCSSVSGTVRSDEPDGSATVTFTASLQRR